MASHDEIEASLARIIREWVSCRGDCNDCADRIVVLAYVRQLLDECKELEQYRYECLNLLAVIHRDGGHHTTEVGLETSAIHAYKARNDMLLELDTLRNECKAKDALLAKAVRPREMQAELDALRAEEDGGA